MTSPEASIERSEQEITLEIETLFGFIDELNYYEMFRLTSESILSEITFAYKELIERFNPALLTAPSEELSEKNAYIILSFNEAFNTLKSSSSRLKYDVLLKQGQLRIEDTQLAKMEDQNTSDPAHAATTEQGKKYWALAMEAANNKNFPGALLQVGFALQYESNNEVFLAYKTEWEAEAKKAPKTNNNAYRIRL